MTDRKFNELKKQVDKIIEYWREPLGLNSHRLRVKYLREYNKERYTVAQIFPLWQYKSHTIEIFMPALVDCEEGELEEDILHELVHVLIAPAAGNDVPENEQQRQMSKFSTQSVAYALLAARDLDKNAKV